MKIHNAIEIQAKVQRMNKNLTFFFFLCVKFQQDQLTLISLQSQFFTTNITCLQTPNSLNTFQMELQSIVYY